MCLNYSCRVTKILRAEHSLFVARHIREALDLSDELAHEHIAKALQRDNDADADDNDDDDEEEDEPADLEDIPKPDNKLAHKNSHFTLGSKCRALTLRTLAEHDPRFSRFHIRLSDFMNNFLNVYNIPHSRRQLIKFAQDDKVILFQTFISSAPLILLITNRSLPISS